MNISFIIFKMSWLLPPSRIDVSNLHCKIWKVMPSSGSGPSPSLPRPTYRRNSRHHTAQIFKKRSSPPPLRVPSFLTHRFHRTSTLSLSPIPTETLFSSAVERPPPCMKFRWVGGGGSVGNLQGPFPVSQGREIAAASALLCRRRRCLHYSVGLLAGRGCGRLLLVRHEALELVEVDPAVAVEVGLLDHGAHLPR